MVAECQVEGHRKRRKQLLQQAISRHLTAVGQIASDQDEGGIGVIAIDAVDRCGKPCRRVEAVHRRPPRPKMEVGQHDEFQRTHCARPSASRYRAEGMTPALSRNSRMRRGRDLVAAIAAKTDSHKIVPWPICQCRSA